MTPARRNDIHGFADRIRDALELSPPVDLPNAVRLLGGELKFDLEDSDEIEAMVAKTSRGFVIRLRKDRKGPRHKFSIAHELGHLFLHMGYLVDHEKWESIRDYKDSVKFRYGYSTEELEAHEFAAAFLMPKREFAERAEMQYRNGRYDLARISEYFDVSIEAARTRGRWLGLFAWT